MRRLVLAAIPLLALATPVAAQMDPNMPGMSMPGMKMPMKPKPGAATKKPTAKSATTKRTRAATTKRGTGSAGRGTKGTTRHSIAAKAMPGVKGMDMSDGKAMPSSRRQGHDMSSMPGMALGQPMQGDMSSMPGMSPGKTTKESDMSSMPGMDMGTTGASTSQTGQMRGSMPAMPGMAPGQSMQGGDMASMPGMDMSNVKTMPAGMTKPVAGNVPAPAPPTDHAADNVFGADAMRGSRDNLGKEQGGQTFHMVLFNLAEYQFRNGGDGYRWDGQAWYGGDINRLTLRTEGDGAVGGGVDAAEVQALYSRTIGPYWNVQAGVRYDFKANPSRTYATVAFQGLAQNFFDVEAALFLSDKGDLLGRLEGYYDQRITQRFILQPRVELNLAAQDVPENRVGAGLSNAELGLRLRYEIKREFAPYVGFSWDRRVGNTARYIRSAGQSASSRSFVLGIRTWF